MSSPALALLLAGVAAALAWVLLRPERRLLRRWLPTLRRTERTLIEDALKHLYDSEYYGRTASLQSLAGALAIPQKRAAALLNRLLNLELIASDRGEFELTPRGRGYALRVIRTHRLWERYLAEHTGLPETEWHEHAERREHTLTAEQAESLAAQLGHPRYDPHGDPIPTERGDIPPPRGGPLTALGVGDVAAIVHVEDEPDAVYAQLVAAGLRPGMRLRLLECTAERLRLEVDGDERVLAPVVAQNVHVVSLPTVSGGVTEFERLSALTPGERARVVNLSRACRGPQRRRLLDLGLLPGTEVRAEFAAPSGDPVAYRIRGAAIALRREQADLVHIQRLAREAS